MLHLISRVDVFLRSGLVDHYVSDSQQSWYEQFASDIDDYIGKELVQAGNCYDHLDPFQKKSRKLNDHGFLAFPKKEERESYIVNFPFAFAKFCKLLGVNRLYLIEELKC